jgi:hypothetical protein
MSKWNKWKLIHKETGFSFNQYREKHWIKSQITSYDLTKHERGKVIPVMLRSGVLAVYVNQAYYPYMFFLDNKEWSVIMVPASPLPTE